MKILYKKSFIKSYNKFKKSIRDKIKETLSVFCENPFDESLHNHGLHGNYKYKRSIDVTGDIRIIFKELSDGKYEIVEVINVGTHSQLYR